MGHPPSDDTGVNPTWHVDTQAAAGPLAYSGHVQRGGLSDEAANLRYARITQAVTDAILLADDLKSLHARVGQAFADSAIEVAHTWLYRRTSLQGPCELISLHTSVPGESASLDLETLATFCVQAMSSSRAQSCHIPMPEALGLRVHRLVFVAPLQLSREDAPDGAIAFALHDHQQINSAAESFFKGLAWRIARAWRVHDQHEHQWRIQTFLNNAMQAAYAGTWHIDLRTGQTLTSPTTNLLFGEPVTNQDVFGLVNRLIHPDDRDSIRRTYYEAIRLGEPYYHEYRIIRKDGSLRWLCSRGIPVYDADGKPSYVSGIIADITDRVEDRLKLEALAKHLQDAVGARDVFLARASHELKTPLTALQLLLENQQRKLARDAGAAPSVETHKSVTKRSLAQTLRLTRLIDDMMDVSRIQAKRLALELGSCNLSKIIDDTVLDYAGRFAATKAALHVDVQHGVSGHWDCGRLEQVVTNLLNNALRYAPGKDTYVSLTTVDKCAVLRVEDCGPGVAEHLRETLFDSFHSGDSLGAMGGLGLGLHICREIAHLHQGTLHYDPRATGGSCFILKLPLLTPLHGAQPVLDTSI